MERKFELTCTHTVWSIVGCPFSLCRRPTSAAPIQISGKWLFENFTPPGKRLKTVLELQVRYFHLANQVLWKGKLNPTAMKQDTRVDTSCSEQRMGKSWLRTGSGSRVACVVLWTDCEQALCLGKSSPQRRCVFRTEEHQNPSKTAEKMVILLHFRYTFYIPQKTEGFGRRAVRQRGYGLRLLIFKMANDKVDLGQIRYMYTYMQLLCVGITRYPRAVWDMETSIYPDKKPRNRSR